MTSSLVPISEARAHLSRLVRESADDDVVLMNHGRPAAILISAERYESLMEELEDLRDRLSVHGGVGVNLALRESYLTSGTATSAFWAFGVFYLVASVLTWAIYVRRGLKSAGELVPATTAPAGLAYV